MGSQNGNILESSPKRSGLKHLRNGEQQVTAPASFLSPMTTGRGTEPQKKEGHT